MFDWFSNAKKQPVQPAKNYSRLVPRIASLVEGVLEYQDPQALLVPYSRIVLKKDYEVMWLGGGQPHSYESGDMAIVYFNECKHLEEFKRAIDTAAKLHGVGGAVVLKQSVDILSTELGFRLKERAVLDT